MSEPFPKLCRDCRFAFMPDGDVLYRCSHPRVNATSAWALSASERFAGVACPDERRKTGWFANCGMKGKLWEKRDE